MSIVNPQGTVTTVTNNPSQPNVSLSSYNFIHENFDETMFRPVVTVINDMKLSDREDEARVDKISLPMEMKTQLVVPVIDEKRMDSKKKDIERQKQRQQDETQQLKNVGDKIGGEKFEEINGRAIGGKSSEAANNAQKNNRKGQKSSKKTVEFTEKNIDPKFSDSIFPVVNAEIPYDQKNNRTHFSPTEVPSPEGPPKTKQLQEKISNIKLLGSSEETFEKCETDISLQDPIKVTGFNNFKAQVVETITKVECTQRKVKRVKKGLNEVKAKKPENFQSENQEIHFCDDQELEKKSISSNPFCDDYRQNDKDLIMKISKHESIGDDVIEVAPHEKKCIFKGSPENSNEVEILEEHFTMLKESPEKSPKFIKSEDFYEIENELPPLEPLETFDVNFEPICFEEEEATTDNKTISTETNDQKQKMKQELSELLKDTNMIFAMCSSLKEDSKDNDEKSMSSSQIQCSTTSSQTTNTTTATFASASSNPAGEGQDSDYKSLELDLEEAAQIDSANEVESNIPAVHTRGFENVEDISSFEATSSETDDSSKKSNCHEPNFKHVDDEELRPLLQASISSLPSPVLLSIAEKLTIADTTEANTALPPPEISQKQTSLPAGGSNNGNKRKTKKKRK